MLGTALALLLAAAPGPAAPPAADARAVARRVQDFYERTQDLEARFTQVYTYGGFGGRKQTSKGVLRVKKPGMMRWDYASPENKTIAVKGSRLVQYEPAEKQAYVDEHFDASAMSAAVTFLLGKGDLAREFDLALSDGGWLVLTPKTPDPRVQSVELDAGPSGEVRATRVRDGSGNVNEIRLEDVRRNVGLSASAFEVKLPSDVHRVGAPSR
jgi:outer membrane lipoprotein carrier protein